MRRRAIGQIPEAAKAPVGPAKTPVFLTNRDAVSREGHTRNESAHKPC